MVDIRSKIREAVIQALKKASKAKALPAVDADRVAIQYPPSTQKDHGEYAVPIALHIASVAKKKPIDVAKLIVKHMELPELVEKVEVVAPGFLNFRVKQEWYVSKLDNLIEAGEQLGRSRKGAGKTIHLEFVSANPTGLPSIGNGRTLFWADTLGNVLTHAGYDVTREYYVNDTGTQVQKYGESVLRRILQRNGVHVDFSEELYQGEEVKVVAEAVEERLVEDERHKKFSEKDLADKAFLETVARISVEETVRGIREVMSEVCGVQYDVWFSERKLHESGDVKETIEALKKKGVTYEKEGALWFRSTTFGDDKDRVLIRKDGSTTYFAADVAYHRDKFQRGYNTIANFWGADHHGHIARIVGAMKALEYDTDRLRFVITQMVRVIDEGVKKKISKRAGTAVPIHEVIQRAGLSAARYFLIAAQLSSHMDFDMRLAKEQSERNPVFYVQYAYVRLCAIHRNAKKKAIVDGDPIPPLGASVPLDHPSEQELLRLMFRLPEVVEDVAESWEVHRLPRYAYELASAVQKFYDAVPVLQAESEDLQSARLTLVFAAKVTLGVVLDLLGVEKREIM